MIRINLFPVRQARQIEQGKRQLAIGGGILSVLLAVIVIFHGYQTAENDRIKLTNTKLTEAINILKKEVGDYEVIKQRREDLKRQRDTLKKLQANRAGPVFLMRELSDVLSVGKGPSFDKPEYEESLRRDPNAGFNPNWDVKRLWLTSFEEKNHGVTMKGQAKSTDDVAEFTKRLKLSPFFSDVYWQQTVPQFEKKLNVAYVSFDMRCKVNF